MAQFIGSTTPLGASATFTSRTVQPEWAQFVAGSVFADQGGTLNVDFSGDGIHFDASYPYTVVASTGMPILQQVILPYVRFRYVNGGTPQTVFRLFSYFGTYNMP